MKSVDAQTTEGTCAIAVMTKAPRPGEVKTRLSPPLTPDEAAALSSCFLRDTTTVMAAVIEHKRVRGVAVYTPLSAEAEYSEILPPGFLRVPQRGETLGQRLMLALEDLFALGFSSVCLVDSDSPTLPPEALAEAIRILGQPEDCVVLGPSDDGGYYLIGLKNPKRILFNGITWSSDRVFQQTIERARKIDLRVHVLPVWYDVDDATSLWRLCNELFGRDENSNPENLAPATRDYLERLLKREGRERIWPEEVKR